MPAQDTPFEPGAILHAALLGAFKVRGSSFEAWCAENGVATSTARAAIFGQNGGPRGREVLARMIEAADPEVVRAAYMARLKSHVSSIKSGAA